MFNVTIIKIKDIFKYLLSFIIILIIIDIGKRYFFYADKYFNKLISTEVPVVGKVDQETDDYQVGEEKNDDEIITKFFIAMIDTELSVIDSKIMELKKDETEKSEETNVIKEEEMKNKEDETKEKQKELPKGEVKTEIVTKHPIVESYTDKYKGVKIKNETSFNLSDKIMDINNLKIDASNIIIFHTHTCESYTSSKEYSYKPTGTFRTTDLNYTVAKVGDELEKKLKNYNFGVIHNKTLHDYPAYTGSYTRSFSTVSNILKKKSADIIIDLHRDAIGSKSSYDPTVKIGDEKCAQLMFVMGTNGGGLKHENWQSNLKFAIKVQEKANSMYPGLFKPIILRNSRYNQNLGKAACIIEVGSTGNTLEQCLNSMKYLAEIMNKCFS